MNLRPLGAQPGQAGPGLPAVHPSMLACLARVDVGRLLPVHQAVTRPDEDRVLLSEGQGPAVPSTERHRVRLPLVGPSHGAKDTTEPPLMSEHHVADADILDVLDAVGGDDLLTGEEAADDRLDPVLLAGQVEVDGPEQLAVVGHGQGRHAHAGGLGEQVVDPGGAIEHRVLGVHVEVREAARHDCCCSPYRWCGCRWTGVSHSPVDNYMAVIPGRSLHPGRPAGNHPRMSEIVAAQRFRREPPAYGLVAGGSCAAALTLARAAVRRAIRWQACLAKRRWTQRPNTWKPSRMAGLGMWAGREKAWIRKSTSPLSSHLRTS